MNSLFLPNLQSDLTARLAADSYFADVPVLSEKQKDVASEIERAIGAVKGRNGRLGAAAVVLSPVASDEFPDAPGEILAVEIGVLILENVTQNQGSLGTGKPALSLAQRAVRVLKHFVSNGLAQPLQCLKPTLVPRSNFAPLLAYEVRFGTLQADSDSEAKVATPGVAAAAAGAAYTITLSCATSAAAKYYTLDGSYPWPGNPAASLYAAPFTAAAGATVRAAAFAAGLLASNLVEVSL